MRFFAPSVLPSFLVLCCVGCDSKQSAQEHAVHKFVAAAPAQKGAGGRGDAQEEGKPAPRKVIYEAEVHLIVEEFAKAEDALVKLVGNYGGYVAKSDIAGSPGSPRSGHWRVRVPVERFQEFLRSAVELGVPDKNTTEAKDVSEEYYDLEARLKVKRSEEERLLKHLEKSTGKLEDILAVERELTRVRGEIERMDGSIRKLANLSEMSTATIVMREDKDYVPPQSPTFGKSVTSSFSSSLDSLIRFGKGTVVVLAALVPWLAALAVIAIPGWLIVRWRIARHRGASVTTTAP